MTQPAPLQATAMDTTPRDTATTPASSTAPAKPKTLKLPDNALTATIATLLGVLLVLAFNQTDARISDTNNQITRLESKMDAGFTQIDQRFAAIDERFAQQDAKSDQRFAAIDERFAQQDAKSDERFAAQDAKFDEINLKLTALIAALNATAEVEAALEGRLLEPMPQPADEPAN